MALCVVLLLILRCNSYFIAANPSIERHLYSVNLPTVSGLKVLVQSGAVPEPTVLTNTTERGYFRTSFSPFGGFYVLNYG